MLEEKELHLPQHIAIIMLLICSGPTIAKACHLRSWGSSSSSVTSLHTPYGAPKSAQAHQSTKRSAAAGGEIIREAWYLKKEPARPTQPPPPLKKNQQACNQRPQKTCQGHFRIENIPLLFITLNSVPVLKCCFLSC